MQTWIALFRGINVGGNNILPMARLKEHLLSLRLENVRTYIQSGNVVFDAAKALDAAVISVQISEKVEAQHGFRPQVLLMTQEQLRAAVGANPYPLAVEDPKTLHFYFLAEPATAADLKALEDLKSPTENFVLTDNVFYLHAPDGIGRSRLAARAEKCLGVAATGRNYRTVAKLMAMTAGK